MPTIKLCGWLPCSGVIVDRYPMYPILYCSEKCRRLEKARVASIKRHGPLPWAPRLCQFDKCQQMLDGDAHHNQVYCSKDHKKRARLQQVKDCRARKRAEREAAKPPKEDKVKPPTKPRGRPPGLTKKTLTPPPPKPAPVVVPVYDTIAPHPLGPCGGCKHAKANPDAFSGVECTRGVYRACNPLGLGGPKMKEV